MKIILVHGIFDDGSDFKQLKQFLIKHDHQVFIPKLKPNSGRTGIVDLANQLHTFIAENLEQQDHFIVVGFSMGCLVSRYYLQELNGYKRCTIFHAVSGPHSGSILAYFYFGKGAKDLRPGSKFLKQLKQTEHRLSAINLYSYRTPFDLMILPYSSSEWSIAENQLLFAPLHQWMLKEQKLLFSIIDSINGNKK